MVLLQVLITALILSVICAGLLTLILQPAINSANVVDGLGRRLAADAAISKVSAAWQTGGTCSSGAGVACSGSGCSCRCAVGAVTVASRGPNAGPCALTATAP